MKTKSFDISICSFSSGSSGNCYLIKTQETAILLDAGITGKQMSAGLAETGVSPEDIRALFITHEHHDHIRGLSVIHKKIKHAPIYSAEGTVFALAEKLGDKAEDMEFKLLPEGSSLKIGDIEVMPFALSHDAAEPFGYSFSKGEKKISVLTDTGIVREEVLREIADSHIIVIEANHEERMLFANTRYPYELKTRILSDRGHLSNEACANTLAGVIARRKNSNPPIILLAHLSQENNTPAMARVTVENILYEMSYYKERDYYLHLLQRDVIGEVFGV